MRRIFCVALALIIAFSARGADGPGDNIVDKVRRVIVRGSSIPGSLGEVVQPSTTEILARRELAILVKARGLTAINLVGGDYATEPRAAALSDGGKMNLTAMRHVLRPSDPQPADAPSVIADPPPVRLRQHRHACHCPDVRGRRPARARRRRGRSRPAGPPAASRAGGRRP